jgi:hypothetical protein
MKSAEEYAALAESNLAAFNSHAIIPPPLSHRL